MPWDQNITAATFIGYTVGASEDYRVFGILLNNWSVSLSWNYGSGFPYTPYSRLQNINELYLVNTGDGPYTSRVDVSLSKGFRLVSGLGIGVNLSVRNLLDRRNVNMNAGGFNTLTGKVTQYGDYNPSDQTIYPWIAGGTAFDVRVPPYVFDPPRQVVLGVKLTWD